MKKIVLSLLSTVSVVVLLFGYHTSTSGALSTSAPTSIVSGGTSAGVPGTQSSDTSAGAAPPTDQSGGQPTQQPTGSAPSSPAASPSAGTGTPASSTVTGGTAATSWGPVQVELSVDGGKISAVNVLQHPSGNPRDTEINSQALPILIQETLDAQNAQIDMVSGATVTSVGYLQSLQSALDQVGS